MITTQQLQVPSLWSTVRRMVVAEWLRTILHPRGLRFHAVFVGLSLAGALLMGFIARQAVHYNGADAGREFLVPAFSAIGLLIPGVLVAMAACAYRVTADYEDGTAAETFRAVPNRGLAFGVQAGLQATGFAVLTLVSMPVLYLVTESMAAGGLAYPGTILEQGGGPPLLTVPVVVWCLCAMSAAVGSMIRNSAMALATIIAWYALVEELLPNLPGVGPAIGALLPIANGWAFTGISSGAPGTATASIAVLGGWLIVIWLVSTVLLLRRDVPSRS